MFFKKSLKTKISKGFFELRKLLKDLNSEQHRIILESLEQYLPDNFVKVFDEIEDKTDISSEVLADIFYSLVAEYISYFRRGESIEEYLKDEKNDKIKDFYTKLFKLDKSFGILSKVAYLSTENPNKLFESTIITDLRPIYYADPLLEPKYCLIKHTWGFSYITGGDIKEIYITLEREDLEEMSKLIERALNKEDALVKGCKEKNIKVFRGLRIVGDE